MPLRVVWINWERFLLDSPSKRPQKQRDTNRQLRDPRVFRNPF